MIGKKAQAEIAILFTLIILLMLLASTYWKKRIMPKIETELSPEIEIAE